MKIQYIVNVCVVFVTQDRLCEVNSITMFPDITDFEIIMYAEPEYRFNVALPDGTKLAL